MKNLLSLVEPTIGSALLSIIFIEHATFRDMRVLVINDSTPDNISDTNR